MKLCLGMDEEPAESLWIWISGQNKMGNVLLAVCYSHDQEEVVDGAFFRKVEETSHLQTLVFMGD